MRKQKSLFTRVRTRLCSLFLILFVLGSATAVDPPNNKPGLQDFAQGGTLLRISIDNPSFEEGTNNVPNHWTPLPSTYGNLYLWDNSVAHTERRSIAIRGSRYQYGRWKSDPIDVQKAGFSFYSLTGSVKTSQNNGEVYLAIAWLDRNGDRITTSDSPMLPEGDNDWQTLTVNALPPDGTVNVSIYCISNHNNGTTWFDTLKLRVTQFPAIGNKSYEQFIAEHPDHPLALAAHLMRVKVLMTQAKWIKEKGFYDSAAQKQASELYAKAATISRNDVVLKKAAAAAGKTLAEEQAQFEALIDKALWEAAIAAETSNDNAKVKEYLQKIVQRNNNPDLKAIAQQWLSSLDK